MRQCFDSIGLVAKREETSTPDVDTQPTAKPRWSNNKGEASLAFARHGFQAKPPFIFWDSPVLYFGVNLTVVNIASCRPAEYGGKEGVAWCFLTNCGSNVLAPIARCPAQCCCQPHADNPVPRAFDTIAPSLHQHPLLTDSGNHQIAFVT